MPEVAERVQLLPIEDLHELAELAPWFRGALGVDSVLLVDQGPSAASAEVIVLCLCAQPHFRQWMIGTRGSLEEARRAVVHFLAGLHTASVLARSDVPGSHAASVPTRSEADSINLAARRALDARMATVIAGRT